TFSPEVHARARTTATSDPRRFSLAPASGFGASPGQRRTRIPAEAAEPVVPVVLPPLFREKPDEPARSRLVSFAAPLAGNHHSVRVQGRRTPGVEAVPARPAAGPGSWGRLIAARCRASVRQGEAAPVTSRTGRRRTTTMRDEAAEQ